MLEMRKHLSDVDDTKLQLILQIKDAYNAGAIDLEEARKQIREKVGTVKPYEIALAEQELKEIEDDECRKENIQKMLELFEEVMDTSRPDLDKNHPIMCYYRENDALQKILKEIEDLVQYPLIKNQWLELYERLEQFKIHLSRKQNQLYSILEQKGFDRPTTTMWTLDNFIRDEIRNAAKLLAEDKDDEFIAMQQIIVDDIRDLLLKEESVLYPTSLAMISEKEFEEMKAGDKEIGFAWIQVDEKEPAPAAAEPAAEHSLAEDLAKVLQKHGIAHSGGVLDVAMGKLTLEQINLIYQHLPVDLSYVDENELVCFYSDTKHRVFPRSKNVIGRNVANCHPRASVHIVEEIIEKFRSGEQDTAEFWINKPDLFIYIQYTAVRDSDGKFRGVLEMMQDCTHIRSLQGSQTLLTWENKKNESTAPAEPVTEECSQPSEGAAKTFTADDITPDTMLKDLLAAAPELRDALETINPKFKMLKTPLARIMLPKASIRIMSERSGMPLEDLLKAIKSFF